jgi:SNW domain-containing protein 1
VPSLTPAAAAAAALLLLPCLCTAHLHLQNLTRPDEEEIERTAKETFEALNKRVNSKLATQNPSTLPEQPGAPTYIKYTPSQQGAAYASGAKQRIIKMQDMPVDPLEPPKFRHTKVPRGTGSPPVPVMHSPPRPVTAEDHANWKIPPCISNWKNAKGYTIPLDKRLAADGRGLQVRLGMCVLIYGAL